MEIPFNRVAVVGNEWEYTRSVVESGQIGGGGGFTRRCEELLEHELGAPRVLLTTSGTHALELAAMLLEPEAVDEVILPSFTFVSTANAFRLAGARLVFADIRPRHPQPRCRRCGAEDDQANTLHCTGALSGVGCGYCQVKQNRDARPPTYPVHNRVRPHHLGGPSAELSLT